ncbi:MAG TPA: hypothetical protein VFX76_06700, partial [Roseiflexaceae bacterium]|nr:hypothetical protein [Roseiflexaceae bacterium]
DLAIVQGMIAHLEQQTGLEHQQYVLAFVPTIDIEATLAGQNVRDEFAPRLEFQVEPLQLQLLKDGTGAQDVLKPLKSSLLKRVRSEPNTLTLPGLTLAVARARSIGLIGLALAMAGICAVGLPLLRTFRRDEPARIRLKYGPLIVDSSDYGLPSGEHAVELATIDDLAKLAEKRGALIVHQANGTQQRYVVRDTAGVFLYQVGGAAAAAEPSAAREPGQPATALLPAERCEVPTVPVMHWQADFLTALREYGRVPDACRAVGISVASAYLEREREPIFALAWRHAQANAQRPYGVKTV